uniref:transposase n=1 Tax=Enterococcus faecium TaxID=1352 RepID=UPI001EEB5418|nr:transposase [Enterococcus faecium]
MKAAVKSLKVRFDLPFVLCIDEFKAMKSCIGKMSFIFMDGQTNQILGLLESRKLAYLRSFFSRYTRQAREKVQYIVMDMNAPYFELAKSSFLPCTNCHGSFSYYPAYPAGIESFTDSIMNTYRKKDRLKYKRLKRYWKLFLKDSYLLDSSHHHYDYSFKRPMTEKATVDELLSYGSTLKLADDTCQCLLYHYKQKDTNYFFEVVNTLDAQLPEWFRKKLTFLNKHRKGIENAFQTPYSNGALEGTNNKIKGIKRVAYGYRNFFHFRDRIYLIKA